MSDENLDKIMEGNFPVEVLDAEGKCIAKGQARLIPGTNAGRFWPDGINTQLDAQMLGPRPTVLKHLTGPVYKISAIELGDMPHAPKYFKFRHRLLGSSL